ncbi:MAG: LysE family translocator [Rhodobacteraceae bacterium]|nr:LysE family translocator [Paracoccaceae bacterium]
MNADLASLLLALGIFSVGFISIGPNILAIIGTSMERGRASGVKLALGVGIGSGIWAALTVAGLTALIAAYAHAITVLKILGAIYLLWLAYRAFRSAATPEGNVAVRSAKGNRLFLQGLAIQMTNPKAALHWIAIVGVGLGPNAPLWVGLSLISCCTLMSVLGHLGYAITFSTQPVVDFYRRSRRWIEAGLGVFFSLAAYKLATYRG